MFGKNDKKSSTIESAANPPVAEASEALSTSVPDSNAEQSKPLTKRRSSSTGSKVQFKILMNGPGFSSTALDDIDTGSPRLNRAPGCLFSSPRSNRFVAPPPMPEEPVKGLESDEYTAFGEESGEPFLSPETRFV